ncbi:dTMP kinase [Pseudomonas aeruginosa]|nr:dTMP kinase [Pseudomonas aeruginosa]MBV5962540.1 dTMP kinase [Pseudomonas aeruginosa]
MLFVSIEGIDGSGKTEQVKLLVEHLRNTGRTVLQTKEPDGGHLGTEVRAILTNPDRQLTPTEQLLLVSAARFDHVRSVIRPALASGQWVISDRFIDSTYAFQVAVSDADLRQLFRSTCDIVVGSTLPDLTIILDLPLEVARGRRDQRRDGVLDPAEATRDFAVIREALIAMARQEPERCHVIDADQPSDAVARDIWRLVEPFL